MKKILVTGALGQIGTELSLELIKRYGNENILLTDISEKIPLSLNGSNYRKLNVLDKDMIDIIIKEFKPDAVFHMAAILSATGEKDPLFCWNVNMNGTLNILDLSVKNKIEKVFIPSSIAVWGHGVPLENTPQESVLKPTTMYGVTKVAGEVLSDYYFEKYNLDVRGIRYPGIISSETLPGGGTTDYAVEIFYEAVKNKKYSCFLEETTTLPMMYMPDCIEATIGIMEADLENLKHHSDFNVASMSFSPSELAEAIKKIIPDFEIEYNPDYRQKIADNWPRSIDDSSARNEWGWNPKYDIDSMCRDMIENLSVKHEKGLI